MKTGSIKTAIEDYWFSGEKGNLGEILVAETCG
jgi:hypothetical protein